MNFNCYFFNVMPFFVDYNEIENNTFIHLKVVYTQLLNLENSFTFYEIIISIQMSTANLFQLNIFSL